jgi:tetratricopeptide (TPR) repeat protein
VRLTTPTVTLGIRGTDWEVEVAPDGTTQLYVLSGVVHMANEFGSIEVGSGEAASAGRGSAPVKFRVVNPKARVQWVSAWRPDPRHWTNAEEQSALSAVIARIEGGEYSAAIAELQPRAAGNAGAAKLLADLLLHGGDAAQAEKALAPFAASDSHAAVLQAHAMALQDDVPRARALLASALARKPDDVDLLLAVGDMAILEGDAAAASAAYARAAALQPGNADAWYGIGLVETERENVRRARAALGESMKLRPDATRAASELGALETFANDLAQGRRLLQGVLARQPADFRALAALGLNELKAGRPAQALEDFLKAGVIEPHYARGWLYSGVAFYQQGDRKRALEAFRKAGELDPLDPMPHLYESIVEADALQFGDAIAAARQAQARMPYLRSLNQAANDQKGHANLGSALASFGLNEWAGFYAHEAYSPYWGGSHLFLADRYTSKFAKNSELLGGFLADPLAFGASNRNSTLVASPGRYGRIDLAADRRDWTQLAATGTVNGLSMEPVPVAYFFSGDLASARADHDDSRARGHDLTAGIGVKPRYDIGVFAFVTDAKLDATLREATLPNDPLAQREWRADAGFNFKLAAENQFWFKAGSGRQANSLDGAIHSPSTAQTLNGAFGTTGFAPDGTLDAFTSSIRQDDVQFRHAFTHSGVQWSWGLEHSRQANGGGLAMTFAPATIGITQQYDVRMDDAYVSARWERPGQPGAQLDLYRQSARLQRQDTSTLDAQFVPPLHFTIEDSAQDLRTTEWNPRIGFKWPLAPLRTVRAVFQKWRRPASAATLAPVDTLGVPLDDRIVNAGGLYRRARLQFDGEIGSNLFLQAFADQERVDNGPGGRRSAISDFEVTQLESLRQRPDVFSPRADIEDTPQFPEGRVDSLGLAANWLVRRNQSIALRYVHRRAVQTGAASGLAIPFMPRQFLLLASQWTLPGRWLAGVSATWRSERFRDAANVDRVAPGWAFGATVYWESEDKSSSVQGLVENVLPNRDAGVLRDPHWMVRYTRNF